MRPSAIVRSMASEPEEAQRGAGRVLSTEVLIVGGGMVGLTLAAALAGAEVEVVVLDREAPSRQEAPTFDGRTSAIAWGSAQALAGIGLWPALEAVAEPILEIRVSDGPSLLFLDYRHAEVAPHPLGYIVENRGVAPRAPYRRAQGSKNLRILAPKGCGWRMKGPARRSRSTTDSSRRTGGGLRRTQFGLARASRNRMSPLVLPPDRDRGGGEA